MKPTKLCPFCKGTGIFDKTEDPQPQYFIRCRSCSAEGGWAFTPAGAIDNWEMRDGQRDSDPPARAASQNFESYLQPGVTTEQAMKSLERK